MPLSDIERIDKDQSRPRIVALHFALSRLRSIVSFMNTGAHPDDETSALLATLGFRDGLDLSFACANRGEGGQNDLGTEAEAVLGTVRTAEMEAAARVLDLRLYWLSESPADSIFDFGFSKSGDETLLRWNHKRTLLRFVTIVRQERPDIICPTFLDIPGQHGHHRAMTALAHEVMDRAADPDFVTGSLDPWQVKKLYLPAWGGGGYAYDDEEPPPAATLLIEAAGRDSLSGWSWENIGQQSRRFHLTQNMGRWVTSGTERNWPLHLARTCLAGRDDAVMSGLPATLAELAEFAHAPELTDVLQQAHDAIEQCLNAFPDFTRTLHTATTAIELVRAARQACPAQARTEIEHRLARKESQLSRVIRLAAGVSVTAAVDHDLWRPGDSSQVRMDTAIVDETVTVHVELETQSPWQAKGQTLSLDKQAQVSNPYPSEYFPDSPCPPALAVHIELNGVCSSTTIPLDITPTVLPSLSASVLPAQVLMNTATDSRIFHINIQQQFPADAVPELELPEGWMATVSSGSMQIDCPAKLNDGLYELPLLLNGKAAFESALINYSHIEPRVFSQPCTVRVRALDIKLPDVRLAYVGGGNDDVATWLTAMGLDVVQVTDTELQDERSLQALLGRVDTLVVGLFAFRTRPRLAELSSVINAWIDDGGHLLTLYHRPWDAWDPERVPPRRLEIGQPSLRYRVTDEKAVVTHLIPEHPLLNHPNRIDEFDWAHWHKERGLYFAKSWADDYDALLSMSDPGEQAHRGALLSARIGKGQHTHTSLILHHQMNKLVPGSFRLIANLVS